MVEFSLKGPNIQISIFLRNFLGRQHIFPLMVPNVKHFLSWENFQRYYVFKYIFLLSLFFWDPYNISIFGIVLEIS